MTIKGKENAAKRGRKYKEKKRGIPGIEYQIGPYILPGIYYGGAYQIGPTVHIKNLHISLFFLSIFGPGENTDWGN